MRIGILGGTFSPIHRGHIAMAEAAYNELALDEVIIMPSGNPPHKNDVLRAEDRLNMIRIAIRNYPYMSLSDYEIMREGTTYTADTLVNLTGDNPDNEYTFIVGADSLVYMSKWYKPEVIFAHAVIAVCSRNDTDNVQLNSEIINLRKKYDADIKLLDFECVDVSSHDIRQSIINGGSKDGDDCLAYVNPQVLDYIYSHNLYCTS